MIEDFDQFTNRYSSSLVRYEQTVASVNSIPKLINKLQAKQSYNHHKEKAITLRKRILFNETFEDIAKKYTSQFHISPYPQAKDNILRLRSYFNDPTNISSDMYIIKPKIKTGSERVVSDIFSEDYTWKKEKVLFKPKTYALRVGRKAEKDIKNYTPNYSCIEKKVPYVIFAPLRGDLPPLKLKKEEMYEKRLKCKKYMKMTVADSGKKEEGLKKRSNYTHSSLNTMFMTQANTHSNMNDNSQNQTKTCMVIDETHSRLMTFNN